MSNILSQIDSLPDVSFIDDMTLEEVLAEMINDYQVKYKELTENSIILAKADTNRLILYACSVQIYQGYQFIDRAGKQDLLKYSYGSFLDNLGALKGVIRNAAQPASVTVRFILSEVRLSVTGIDSGTRVAAGEIYFESTEYKEVPAGDSKIDIVMKCTKDGVGGNDFLVGELTTLVDPIGYVSAVSNVTVSDGGSEIESDVSLAERIFLAPSSYSVAGPDDAYKYWAKTYSQKIADVEVTSPSACVVDIRFILQEGVLPDKTMIQGLQNFFRDKKIRPLTDQVIVSAPDVIDYSISATYYINKSDISKALTIQAKVNEAVKSYIGWQNIKIGRDINPSELVKRIMAAGAKRVDLTTPIYTAISNSSVARMSSQTITCGGIEDD